MNNFEQEISERWKKYQTEKNELFPNIMLIGASGAGKSSLINKIFGGNFAHISNVKPETQGYNTIYRGKEYGKSVNLIDTAGYELGQVDTYYKDIHSVISNGIHEEMVHIIWYCISVINERIEDMDINILQKLMVESSIRRRICIVFTKCDYDTDDGSKVTAFKAALNDQIRYPISSFETSTSNELDLDLDLPQLIQWSADAIDDEDLRNKFIAAQVSNLDVKHHAVKKIINMAVTAAIGIGAVPIPFSDAVLLVPVQVGMIGKIIDIYGVSNLASVSKTVISDVIISNLGKSISSGLLKMIPVVGPLIGGAINAGVAGALTGAIGYAASEICYKNVKSYLNGNTVAWDQMFGTSEFTSLVSEAFRQNR